MNLDTVVAATSVYRKGPRYNVHRTAGVEVHEIYGFPHQDEIPDGIPTVDCHFVTVAVDPELAERARPELEAWLKSYPEPDRLKGGPSYIEIAALGGIEQETAFRIFALGQVLGLWQVLTPERLGITGVEADRLAGSGMVMISGWKAA